MGKETDTWDFPTSQSLGEKPISGSRRRGGENGYKKPKTFGEKDAKRVRKELEELFGPGPWSKKADNPKK